MVTATEVAKQTAMFFFLQLYLYLLWHSDLYLIYAKERDLAEGAHISNKLQKSLGKMSDGV